MTRTQERITFISLLIIAMIGIVYLAAYSPTRTTYINQSVTATSLFTPASSLFRLQSTRGIIYSAYLYEANLIDNRIPIADIDYMLPFAARELVTLPGDRRDRYFYYGQVYVPGSGIVEKWGAPNDGRFAFLHLVNTFVSLPPGQIETINFVKKLNLHKPGTCVRVVCSNTTGDENTAKVAAYIMTHNIPLTTVGSGFYTGGTAVGHTGWPTSPYYGNGSFGPLDAHLCFLLDQATDNYMSFITYRPRFTFVKSLWDYWRYHHHKSLISPKYKGKLSYGATLWIPKQDLCRGVVTRANWYASGGFVKQVWQGCTIYFWPHHSNWKPEIRKNKVYRK